MSPRQSAFVSDNTSQWVIGQLISAGVLRGLLNRSDEWGWRIPYAVQWVWPIPIIIGVVLAPEVSIISKLEYSCLPAHYCIIVPLVARQTR